MHSFIVKSVIHWKWTQTLRNIPNVFPKALINMYICTDKHGVLLNCHSVVKWGKGSPVQVVDYVGVFVFPHHQDLVDDQLFLGLLLEVHLLDGHLKKLKGICDWAYEDDQRINKLHRLNGLSTVWRTSWPVAMSMAVYTVPDALRIYKTPLIEQKFNLRMYQIWPVWITVIDFCIHLNSLPTWGRNTVEHIVNDQRSNWYKNSSKLRFFNMSTKPTNKTKFLIISYHQIKSEQTGCYLRHELPQQMWCQWMRAANDHTVLCLQMWWETVTREQQGQGEGKRFFS